MSILPFPSPNHDPSLASVVVLSMAQLSPLGLSEQWVLRDCGDRHWALIAQALGQDRAVFTDPEGRAVYAAFCATSLRFEKLSSPLLGEHLEIHSKLYSVTSTRLASEHELRVDGQLVGTLRMISTFVTHDVTGSNRRIRRSSVCGQFDLSEAPDTILNLDRKARALARSIQDAPDLSPPIYKTTPVFALDFNAVGLLYFPTFSRVFEEAKPSRSPLSQRDVFYLGNINEGETVSVHNSQKGQSIRRGDGKIIAHAETT